MNKDKHCKKRIPTRSRFLRALKKLYTHQNDLGKQGKVKKEKIKLLQIVFHNGSMKQDNFRNFLPLHTIYEQWGEGNVKG